MKKLELKTIIKEELKNILLEKNINKHYFKKI